MFLCPEFEDCGPMGCFGSNNWTCPNVYRNPVGMETERSGTVFQCEPDNQANLSFVRIPFLYQSLHRFPGHFNLIYILIPFFNQHFHRFPGHFNLIYIHIPFLNRNFPRFPGHFNLIYIHIPFLNQNFRRFPGHFNLIYILIPLLNLNFKNFQILTMTGNKWETITNPMGSHTHKSRIQPK